MNQLLVAIKKFKPLTGATLATYQGPDLESAGTLVFFFRTLVRQETNKAHIGSVGDFSVAVFIFNTVIQHRFKRCRN